MITSVYDSTALAALLNESRPATPEDAAENPSDWTGGLWVAGTVYEVDAEHTTPTRLVLADGTAAADWSPAGTPCRNHGYHRTAGESTSGHWCPADRVEWTYSRGGAGVTRDWCTVNVWADNGFSETTTFSSCGEATAAFDREVADVQGIYDALAADEPS